MRNVLFALLATLSLAACGIGGHTPLRVDPQLDALFTQLEQAPDDAAAAQVESQIWQHWSDSGSPTVNILVERAAAAEGEGNAELAERFLEQASDLAPTFAEPWNRRANIAYRAYTTIEWSSSEPSPSGVVLRREMKYAKSSRWSSLIFVTFSIHSGLSR